MLTFKAATKLTSVPRRRGRPCLIVGAGRAGRSLAWNLRRAPEFGLRPVGFLDDRTPSRVRRGRTSVLGRIEDMAEIASSQGVDLVIIAIPSLPSGQVRAIAGRAQAAGLTVRYLPSFLAALERDMRATDLRTINFDHLLGREEVRVVREQSRRIVAGKRVLVTGAGGSIGSALCRQIQSFDPARLVLLDHDESNLHLLQLELTGQGLLDSDDNVIADIRDRERMRQIFRDMQPQVVFHAAAHKHLPLLERHPCEGVKSNVVGTANVFDAAVEAKAERCILISTDKAADPASVLGATKRIAELIMQARAGGDTRMAAVRFGNVLGSRGSLLSVLAEQLQTGRPVTVTSPDVTRFFMTIDEAAGLVLEAAEMADFGEIFVLDMGEPVRIVDLVRNYASVLHLDERQYDICFTGLRPGEKLNEALFSDAEEQVRTAHPRVLAARPRRSHVPLFEERFAALVSAADRNDITATRCALSSLLPEYAPAESAVPALCASAPYPDDF
jgi:FlaA1/EpsC-like NDP-sugar epimerase